MTMDIESTHLSILQGISEIKSNLSVNTNETKNIKETLGDIKTDVKGTKDKVEFQNGRVRKLEDWTVSAQSLIENNAKSLSTVTTSYENSKTKIWTAISVLLVVGGVIITLSIMAIDTKIQNGITKALSMYEIEIK